ncbi:MAG: group 1 truncated hemoglobin [Pseudomonadota bacterium]
MRWLSLWLVLTLGACATEPERTDDRVYRDLGGQPGVERLVDHILDRLYVDARIGFLFDPDNRPHFRERLVEQICFETGGGCSYTGLTMPEAHAGQEISAAEFEAFLDIFIVAMEDAGIDYGTQNRVLATFAPMRPDIIQQPPGDDTAAPELPGLN